MPVPRRGHFNAISSPAEPTICVKPSRRSSIIIVQVFQLNEVTVVHESSLHAPVRVDLELIWNGIIILKMPFTGLGWISNHPESTSLDGDTIAPHPCAIAVSARVVSARAVKIPKMHSVPV